MMRCVHCGAETDATGGCARCNRLRSLPEDWAARGRDDIASGNVWPPGAGDEAPYIAPWETYDVNHMDRDGNYDGHYVEGLERRNAELERRNAELEDQLARAEQLLQYHDETGVAVARLLAEAHGPPPRPWHPSSGGHDGGT